MARPPEYKTEYCEKLIKHMSAGLSYETFAAEIDTTRQSLYNWEKQYPEFAAAKVEAFDKCQSFWEKLGMTGIMGKIKNFQSAVYIFNMKNRFGWRDRQDVEVSGSGPISITYQKKDDNKPA